MGLALFSVRLLLTPPYRNFLHDCSFHPLNQKSEKKAFALLFPVAGMDESHARLRLGERSYLSAGRMTAPSQTRRSHPSLLAAVEDSPGCILNKNGSSGLGVSSTLSRRIYSVVIDVIAIKAEVLTSPQDGRRTRSLHWELTWLSRYFHRQSETIGAQLTHLG